MYSIDLPEERRVNILDELRQKGKVVAAELSELYGVSEDTIRRDLRDLANAGMLKRVHGGALPISPNNAPYFERDKQRFAVKVSLAHTASKLVRDGQVILFGSGTTNAEIAKNLPLNLKATIVTISPLIALYLAEYPYVDVIQVGGKMSKRQLVTCDAESVAQVRRFAADICFLGICSLHPEVGITGNNYDEGEMSRALIEQSGEVVATVTMEKLGTVAPFVVAPIEAITHIVTENQVLDDKLAPYQTMGIQIIKAA